MFNCFIIVFEFSEVDYGILREDSSFYMFHEMHRQKKAASL